MSAAALIEVPGPTAPMVSIATSREKARVDQQHKAQRVLELKQKATDAEFDEIRAEMKTHQESLKNNLEEILQHQGRSIVQEIQVNQQGLEKIQITVDQLVRVMEAMQQDIHQLKQKV